MNLVAFCGELVRPIEKEDSVMAIEITHKASR